MESAAITVTVNPIPVMSLPAFKPICINETPFILTGGLPAGGIYSGTGVSSGKFNPIIAGIGEFFITYSFTNLNGCTNTAKQSITVTSCDITCKAGITASCATTFCSGGSVVLTASEGVSYLWYPGGQITQRITVTTSGNYSVKVTYVNKCAATSPATSITVNPLPPIPVITPSCTITFCEGGKVILSSSVSNGNKWSTGEEAKSITVTKGGNYFVTVTNAAGCKANSAITKVTVNPLPPIPVITATGPTTFCTDDKVILISSAATGNRWSNGSTSKSIIVAESGLYAVTVNNPTGCKSTSATTKVVVNKCSTSYCVAKGLSADMGYIRNVFVCNGYKKTSFWNGYSDYTSLSVNTASGKLMGIAITPGYLSNFKKPKVYIRIWVDWNADGDFSDEGEMVCNKAPTNTKLKLLVKVPHTVRPGKLRMRIVLRQDAQPDACGTFRLGEVEDYSIFISAARASVQDAKPEDFVDFAGPVLKVYPNPASALIVVEREGYSEDKANENPAKLIMSDASGRVVLEEKTNKLVYSLDVSKLTSGMYIITVTTDEGTATKKVVIQH